MHYPGPRALGETCTNWAPALRPGNEIAYWFARMMSRAMAQRWTSEGPS